MFNDKYGLTQAVLDGRKTMTRRIIPIDIFNACDFKDFDGTNYKIFENTNFGRWDDIRNYAAYKIGEVVAIAQSYKDCWNIMPETRIKGLGVNAGLWIMAENHKGWNNKMFVQAEEMPHHIRITNISVERLQDISDEDCYRDGGVYEFGDRYYHERETYWEDNDGEGHSTPQAAFERLIDKVSGKGTWNNNPFVFVYRFKLVD